MFTGLWPGNLVWFNSLWPSDTIWRQRSGSTLAQVMDCCLTAPSHYLNQCWLIISEVQRHSLGQFHKRCLNHQSLKSVWKLRLKFQSNFPGANELNTAGQGWGQIRICICKYKYKYSVFVFVFVFDQISSHVFVFVFDPPYLVYLTNTFSNTLFSWAVF